jgi:putative membrane protein
MLKLLINLALNAFAFLITQQIIDRILPGQFQIRDFPTALIAALLLGLINSTIRPILKFLTFPLTLLTLGLSSLGINALCLGFVASQVPGFQIKGIIPTIAGSIVLSIVSTIIHWFHK